MTTAAKVALIGLLVVGIAWTASAQISLGTGAFAAGGALMSNGTYTTAGTAGQSVIGRAIGTTYSASAGFWGDGGTLLDVEGPAVTGLPDEFVLLQNYPNPFNPTTVISCQLPVASNVKLVVYDMLGREVAVLVNEPRSPGRHEMRFDARGLPSGVYIYRLTAGDLVDSKKMVVVK